MLIIKSQTGWIVLVITINSTIPVLIWPTHAYALTWLGNKFSPKTYAYYGKRLSACTFNASYIAGNLNFMPPIT